MSMKKKNKYANRLVVAALPYEYFLEEILIIEKYRINKSKTEQKFKAKYFIKKYAHLFSCYVKNS